MGRTTSEAQLCRRLITVAESLGWTAYPETGGWDVLLVAGKQVKRVEAGTQIGVEAKVRANVPVLAQARKRSMYRRGPDYISILVHKAGREFRWLATDLGFAVWTRATLDNVAAGRVRWCGLPLERRTTAPEREWLPPIVPKDVVAGAPAPSSLTPWRVAALRVCNALDDGDELTRADIRKMGCDPKYFTVYGCAVPTGRKRGRAELLRKGDHPRRWPAIGWEREAQALRERQEEAIGA